MTTSPQYPQSIDECVFQIAKDNPEVDETTFRADLEMAVLAKKAGTKCFSCNQSIWAIGSAIVGWYGCAACIFGTANNADEYEIDCVFDLG